MKRKRSEKRTKTDDVLAERIAQIKVEHPFWGYRRVWASLRYRDGIPCNQKRIYRIMKERNLLCTKKMRPKTADRNHRPKPQASKPDQIWGTDMTKVFVEGDGWTYITVVLDWYTKKVVGLSVGRRSKSEDWLEALDQALNAQFPEGARGKGLKLVSDNGCQPTSKAYMRYCSNVGVEQIYTSYNNPKGNAETERFMRTMKEELIWLREWKSSEELSKELQGWVEKYNADYLHSALKYRSPKEMEEYYYKFEAA